jgi:hypothetical protein
LDFVSHPQIENNIHCLICFGIEPIRTKYIENDGNISLEDIFIDINKVEKEQPANNKKTDFIKLFDEIIAHYEKQKSNDNEIPKYSFAFFSDYVFETNDYYLSSDLKDRITDFCNNSHFSSFYYLDFKSREDYMEKNKEGIDIFPDIKDIVKRERGQFIPITSGGINLFNLSSNTPIPIYYEYSYSDKQYGTKITFNDKSTNDKFKIVLEANVKNEIDYHHSFKLDDKNFPVKNIELIKPVILKFSGRVTNQFPRHSLVFCSENTGCCRYDIVFFKDFPWYVRYIVTVLIIMAMIACWLWLFKAKKMQQFLVYFKITHKTNDKISICPYLENKKQKEANCEQNNAAVQDESKTEGEKITNRKTKRKNKKKKKKTSQIT